MPSAWRGSSASCREAIDADRPLRHAVEIRHPSFMTADFLRLLREHGIGLVVADTAGKWPKMFHVTADFVYVRLHGDIRIYTSGYSDRALASWTRRIRNWHRDGRGVYVYFDNDVPRLKYAYGPRVTGGNPAWDYLGRR